MIQIGKHKIGPGQPPFIICEIGSNWTTLDDCLHSISAAKACGADAVKFQAYTHEALYGTPGEVKGSLPLDWLPTLKAKADAVGIEFMCSAFSPELVEAVNEHVNIHKVASAEMTHIRILDAVKRSRKPVILSTGASGEADIREALRRLDTSPVILLYCVANYPAQAVDPRVIPLMRDRFGVPVGFSDHSTDVLTIPKAAMDMGAVVIEKHVTFIKGETPDSPHSLTGDQFALMVRNLKNDYQPVIGVHSEEQGMVLKHNRRLIATKAIEVGEVFQEGVNFGIYRSLRDDTHSFSPFALHVVQGDTAKRAIKAGQGIGPSDV